MKWTLLISFFISINAHGVCNFVKKYPHVGYVTLSNGYEVPSPTHALSLDTYSVYGALNYEKTEELLKRQNLHAIKIGDSAFGALGVFDYKESDVGPFREMYFVILATPLKPKVNRHGHVKQSSGLLKLLKLFRIFRKEPTEDVLLYYYRVWSSTPIASLMSQEIWGVPSQYSYLDIQYSKKELGISLSTVPTSIEEARPIVNMKWGRLPKFPIPFGHEILANTLGPSAENLISPVKSCGSTKLGRFKANKGDSLEVLDEATKDLLEFLEFKPRYKELGLNQRAVQFLPEKSF